MPKPVLRTVHQSRRALRLAAAVLSAVVAFGEASAASDIQTEAEARRFLAQATFGATRSTVADVLASGRMGWIGRQYAMPESAYPLYPVSDQSASVGCPGMQPLCIRDNYTLFPLQTQFFRNALTGQDQLRQRVAFALSQIFVTSGLQIRLPYAMANYQRIFMREAFGNFRDILRAVALSPAMGSYLGMANNDKPDPIRGTEPNENFARELLQLFSIGPWKLSIDGLPRTNPDGSRVASYDQTVIEGYSRVFTGWAFAPRSGGAMFPSPTNFEAPLVPVQAHHDTTAKTLLDGVQVPAGQQAGAEFEAAIDLVFRHPNVGPFISRRLIQHFVTSNPSPDYVARVATAFNGTSGRPRGDMKAVIEAILLDREASKPAVPQSAGKLREPVLLLLHFLRAMEGTSDGVWLNGQTMQLGQYVYTPPTVFNYFQWDYRLPAAPTQYGPAFGILNASTAIALSGTLSTAVNPVGVAADSSVNGSTGTRIDFSRWQRLAADPPHSWLRSTVSSLRGGCPSSSSRRWAEQPYCSL